MLLQRAQGAAARMLNRNGRPGCRSQLNPRGEYPHPFLPSPFSCQALPCSAPLLPAQTLELSGPSLATLRGTLAGSREPPGEGC